MMNGLGFPLKHFFSRLNAQSASTRLILLKINQRAPLTPNMDNPGEVLS